MKVLADTSFLIMLANEPLANSHTIVEELGGLEFFIIPAVREELKRLMAKGGRGAKKAALALKMVEEKRIMCEETPILGSVDDTILELVGRRPCPVATLDKDLMRRLRSKGVAVITRRGNRLVLEGSPYQPKDY